ncbi:MAG: DEAD/DEAH box helicase [Pseudonocardiales bacterium]|nr:DEAD/DEAH box helicase [Pseudonocardiales bacterium]MBV9030861.1 DEAD/DEAH box helicase [Pseudonocardiales bacterium]MBW0010593.1 DEAD/DEAH box helicase [Pseudonocardiales bacterium]
MSVALSSPAAGRAEVSALYAPLLERLAAAAGVDELRSALVEEAGAVWSRPGFDTVLSESRLAFTPFDYQLATMQTVLRRMRGRAILADEVGLGKTIEAGLVLSELRMRGLADRALVVTPAGLVGQWREELERKFVLPTTVAARGGWERGGDRPVVLASLAAARRDPLKAAVLDERWDVVIVDEAHRLRNPSSASGRLARALRTRYLLLLTATPVENRLQDLYELVNLVAPGLLGTAAQFRRTHGNADAGVEALRNVDALRARTREIMVRHRRSEVAVLLPQRLAETVLVTPCAAERSLYADIVARIREVARSATPTQLMTLRSLTRLAGSSPAAVAPTLDKVGWSDLTARARAIERPRKTDELLARLRTHVERGEKVLVFTAFRHTLDALAVEVEAAGIPAVRYHGSLSRREKDAAIDAFRGDVPVLLSTESAGEGRNLQFCHVMINIDLPWNPMQIEQRLGRLHRVGQQHDVLLANLVSLGTIEERILHVLESKINLFELVVGELDMILGRVTDDFDFETSVFSAYVTAADDAEFAASLEGLGADLARARTDYLRTRGAVDQLVGEN